MAIAILLDLPGLSAAQYDAIIADGQITSLPANASLHFAGAVADGVWRVIDIWDSQEQFDAYFQSKIAPLMAKHQMSGQPNIQVWPVHNLLK